jgi:hypothetical protein
VGVVIPFWAIWCTRNDFVFHKKRITSFMQATFRETYWQRLWALLQRHDAKARLAGQALEVVVSLDIFAKKQMLQ